GVCSGLPHVYAQCSLAAARFPSLAISMSFLVIALMSSWVVACRMAARKLATWRANGLPTPPRLPFAKRPWLSRSLFADSAVVAPLASGAAPLATAWDPGSFASPKTSSSMPHDAAFTVSTTWSKAWPSSVPLYFFKRAPAASASAKLSRSAMVLNMVFFPFAVNRPAPARNVRAARYVHTCTVSCRERGKIGQLLGLVCKPFILRDLRNSRPHDAVAGAEKGDA